MVDAYFLRKKKNRLTLTFGAISHFAPSPQLQATKSVIVSYLPSEVDRTSQIGGTSTWVCL